MNLLRRQRAQTSSAALPHRPANGSPSQSPSSSGRPHSGSLDSHAPKPSIIQPPSLSNSKEHSFTDLLDHPDTVFDRLKEGRHQAKVLRQFYSDVAAIEQTYCKSLLKLVHSTQFSAGESLQMSLQGMLRFVEDSACLRLDWTRHLSAEMSTDLLQLGEDLRAERSQMTSAYFAAKKSLDKQRAALEKAQTRYYQSVQDIEKDVVARTESQDRGVSDKQISKHSKKIQDAIQTYYQKKAAYCEAIEVYNQETLEFQKSSSYIFQNIEANELGRLQRMQTSMAQFQLKYQEMLSSLESPATVLKTAVDHLNPRGDLDTFVKLNRTGFAVMPASMTFVERSSAVVNRELGLAEEEGSVPEGIKHSGKVPGAPASSWTPAERRASVDSKTQMIQSSSPSVSATGEHESHEFLRTSSQNLSHVMKALSVGCLPPELASDASTGEQLSSKAPSCVHPNTNTQPYAYEHKASIGEPHSFVRTLYEYHDSEEDCLEFGVGDFIMVTEIISDDWARGKLNGREAMFPRSFTEPHEVALATVMYDFEGNSSVELSLSEGQHCWVLDAEDTHWFWACDDQGNQGNFPKSYCTL